MLLQASSNNFWTFGSNPPLTRAVANVCVALLSSTPRCGSDPKCRFDGPPPPPPAPPPPPQLRPPSQSMTKRRTGGGGKREWRMGRKGLWLERRGSSNCLGGGDFFLGLSVWESAKVSHKRGFALLSPEIHSYEMLQKPRFAAPWLSADECEHPFV